MYPKLVVGGPKLISRTGAVGLMQLMFETAVFLAILNNVGLKVLCILKGC